MDKQEKRNELVVKHNDLLRKSRYSLSATEQKILIYLISTIKAEDNELLDVTISLSELCEIMGVSRNGKEYEILRSSIKSLSDKSWWIDVTEERRILFRWITEVTTEDIKGIAVLRLSKHLKPYLLELKKSFTKYELINVLALKSAYSIRLYELFKSYAWQKKWEISVSSFRNILQIRDKYLEFKELKRNVIDRTIKEINDYTDIYVSVETVRTGRKVSHLIFSIRDKENFDENWNTFVNRKKRLG